MQDVPVDGDLAGADAEESAEVDDRGLHHAAAVELGKRPGEPPEVAASGKVPGAVAVPRGLVEFRADPASPMHDKAFDRSKTVVCYCASGGRSALVGKTLKDMGYDNVRNLGGFGGWVQAGGSVEKA